MFDVTITVPDELEESLWAYFQASSREVLDQEGVRRRVYDYSGPEDVLVAKLNESMQTVRTQFPSRAVQEKIEWVQAETMVRRRQPEDMGKPDQAGGKV